MNLKKWLTVLLAIVLTVQAVPVAALSEGAALTAGELTAASALTGYGADASSWHAGAGSLENQTARQLVEYLDELLEEKIHTLETDCEDLELALYRLEQDNPARYQELTSGAFAGYPAQMHSIFRQAESVRMKLEHWKLTLVSQSSIIEGRSSLLQGGSLSDYETRFHTRQIRDAVSAIRAVRTEMAQEAGEAEAWLDGQLQVFVRQPGLNAADTLSQWAARVLSAEDPVAVNVRTSVSARFPTRKTLLGRLSPVSSALADSTQGTDLRVQDDKTISVCTKDPDDKWFAGASVTITDLFSDANPKATFTGVTGKDGAVNVPLSGFKKKDDEIAFSVKITAEGYRNFIADKVKADKGTAYIVHLAKDDGTPYLSGVSFDDHECLAAEYPALINNHNERKVDITAHVENTSDKKLQVILVYQHIEKKQYYRSMSSDGSDKGTFYIEPHSSGTLKVTNEWRRKLRPGGAAFTWKTGTEEKTEETKRLVQMVLTDADSPSGSFAEGSPDLSKGTYTKIIPTQLQAEASAVEQPIIGASLLSSFFGGTGNLFNFNFPMSGGDFFPSGSVGLDVPFAAFIPRISVALDGSTSIILGIDPGGFGEKKGPLLNKDTFDSPEIKKVINATFKDTSAALKKVATGACQYSNADREGGVKMGNIKGTIAPVFGIVYRVESNGETWTSKNLAGVFGVVASLEAGITATHLFPPCPIPLTYGASFTVSLAVYGMVGGTTDINSKANLDEEVITHTGFSPEFSGLSILVRLSVNVFIGAGVKGLLSLTVNGYGYLSFLFELKGRKFTHLRISAGFGFYLLLEAVFWHARFDIWNSPDYELFDGEWPKASASLPRTFSELFLPSASADGEPEESLPLSADDYPDLIAQAEKVCSASWNKSTDVKIQEIGGDMFAFYISKKAGQNKRSRVMWMNLTTGRTGTFEAALQDAASRKSLVLDPDNVFTDDGSQSFIREADKMFGETNAALFGQDDLSFDLRRVDIDDAAIKSVYGDLHVLFAVCADAAASTEEEIKISGTPTVYMLGFIPDGNHGLTVKLPMVELGELTGRLPYTNGLANWHMLYSYPMKGKPEELKDMVFEHMTSTAMGEFSLEKKNCFLYASMAIGNNVTSVSCIMPMTMTTKTDKFFASQMRTHYKGDMAVVPREGEQIQAGASPDSYGVANSYYYLRDSDKTAGNRQLYYHSRYSCVLLDDKSIPYYRVFQDGSLDHVFTLTEETLDSGKVLHHLHAARIEHPTGSRMPTYRLTDLDLTLPGAGFNVERIGSTVYLYWVEEGQKKDDKSMSVYRLNAVAYDPDASIASDEFVLAQFEAPADQPISQILLTAQKGYYVTDSAVWSFPLKLVAAMDLDAVVLDHDVIGVGENDTVLIRMVNNGNLSIRGFTITESTVGEDGSVNLVETVRCDTEKPDNNVLHLEGDKPEDDIKGKDAIWRENVGFGTEKQTYWEIKQTVRTFSSRTEYKDDTKQVDLSASEILPGQAAAFTMLMKSPVSWNETANHRLQFDLTEYTANTDQLQSLAMEHGLLPQNVAGAQSLTWSRSAGGTMELDQPLLQSGSGGFQYATGLKAPDSAVLNHSLQNLDVDHRVYVTPDGERRISIYITNDSSQYTSIRLYCELRYDGREEVGYLDLPYDPDSLSHGRGHTLDFPVSALDDGSGAKEVEVTIRGVGLEEWSLLDNSFTVRLNEDDPLRIIVQPQSQTALEEETVEFFVQAAGGTPPYQYRWQVWMGESLGWQDLNATEDTLVLERVHMGMNGWRYRCIVTDRNTNSVTSEEAVLTVLKKTVPTGDASQPLLLLIGAVGLFVLWILLRRKKEA